ncbi:MAG TPA: biotin/lipoyl-binding protein [Blastocatellia bacterium]|nr:biotin/lipoyl-binding protein [Blastocatellia bacterium]
MRIAAFTLIVALLVSATSACRKTDEGTTRNNLVVINAPVAGQVRRVLVREGAQVSEGTAIIEIAVGTSTSGAQSSQADQRRQSRAAVETSVKEIAEAEADVQRTLVDVQRAEQSLASGFGSQAEVDAARARFLLAQQQLDALREKAQTARDNLTFQRGRGSSNSEAPREEIVSVRVTASGTVRAISARVGQQVAQGQPLATLSTEK